MRILKHIISWVVWTVIGLYALVMIAVRTPWAQQQLGAQLSEIAERKLGTKVHIGRIDVGFFNRLILDDVVVHDQNNKQMLRVARMTAKIDLVSLALGRISISSAQLFGAHLKLYRQTADSDINIQFVLDSLASKDTTTHTPLDLRVNSFIMRHSSVCYDQWDAAPTTDRFNPKHLDIRNISAHVILKALKDDSLNVNVKRLTCKEQSGIDVKRLSMRLTAGNDKAILQDFHLQLPDTYIHTDSIFCSYDRQRLKETLYLWGRIDNTYVTPSDFRSLLPKLQSYQNRIALAADFSYQNRTLSIDRFLAESDKGDISLIANGILHHPDEGKNSWRLNVDRFGMADETIEYVSKNIVSLPETLLRLGNIQMEGAFIGDEQGTLHADADLTTDIGQATVQLLLDADKQFAGSLKTEGMDVGRLLDNEQVGSVAANVEVSGVLDKQVAARGAVDRLEYDGETYTNIELDATYITDRLTGWLQVSDPKVAARVEIDLTATSLNDAVGTVSLHHLSLPQKDYRLDYLRVESGFDNSRHFVTLNSDFAHANLSGEFDYATLAQSLANAIGSKLPTLPGLPPSKPSNNNFDLHLVLGKTDWLQKLLGIDLDIKEPVMLNATVNDRSKQITAHLDAPAFAYAGSQYRKGKFSITCPSDTLFLNASIGRLNEDGVLFDLSADGNAADNNLSMALSWNNNYDRKPLSGTLNVSSRLYRNFEDKPEAHLSFLPSDIVIDKSTWQVEPSDVLYSTDRLLIDHFSVHNGEQFISVDGAASKQKADSVTVTLRGVEVAYILDQVGFDAVEFSGRASGKAFVTSAFNDPDASANLVVNDFKFEDGRMGVLHAHVDWNKRDKQIDIHATANDGPEAMTYINGYVSPERNYIDLGISARGTYLDFMHSYTKSFISNITGHGTGDLRLAGPLSAINLTGGLVVDGEATITPLNTTYWLKNDSVTLVYNEILLDSLAIYDKDGGVGYLSGAVHHRDLTNLSLDLHVSTDNLLGYDVREFGDQSFYGTVYAAGDVDISMRGNDVRFDCNVTPLKNSVFVYNAAQTDAISNQEFITWKKHDEGGGQHPDTSQAPEPSSTNIYMNFLVNATPDGTMRILMDAKTGDYITLNGTGTLQASYYNKGTFQMFGTYTVNSGTYDVTIQNIINKKFQFQPDGTIVFGGDPYSAALNLQALYTVNGVSLSDLQLGNSFSSNTVRVNCLMNIGGQPSAPQVTFDLDLPNVNADEKQMVRSLLSSQQEMNQQVLYLLGIGRFYSQGQNNANQQQQDQTSLAMQSFLSGTLSTQINSVINEIVQNDDWNFGANISTGTEGWNNAEYEGIVNGRMLNNRLLINGQFGYRDKAMQATPSFIGDFDIRYLLMPTGNLALKVYNQTNDRYFTRSSLNTQGVGIIMKKDFNGLNDFFGLDNKKEK